MIVRHGHLNMVVKGNVKENVKFLSNLYNLVPGGIFIELRDIERQ